MIPLPSNLAEMLSQPDVPLLGAHLSAPVQAKLARTSPSSEFNSPIQQCPKFNPFALLFFKRDFNHFFEGKYSLHRK